MRPMLLAFAAIAAIGVGAFFALQNVGFSSEDRQSSSGAVRLD